ncbi:MAG TPA: hypothetical protein VGG41_07920 [Solirubrobacteraceae bacterium]|jgi:hypothetical protein
MDLLFAVRDLGVGDPAIDSTREQSGREALAREIDQATAGPRPGCLRRSRRRARVAVPALAVAVAAGAAVVVATGAAGGSNGSSNIGGGGSAGSQIGAVTHGQDVAYIVRRVRAQLVAGTGEVMEYPSTGGNTSFDSWGYTDPQTGAQYLSSVGTLANGTTYYSETQDGTPSNGGIQYRNVFVDPIQHVYAVRVSHTSAVSGLPVPAPVQQLQQKLKSGEATREGTVTINGVAALKISFATSQGPQGTTSTLYVDPHSYEPMRFVWTAGTSTDAVNWLPATAANIANAEPAQIPAAYTQVSLAQFNKMASKNSSLPQNAS